MIIESINGNYYCDPQVIRPNWILRIRDESLVLFLAKKRYKDPVIPKELKVEILGDWFDEDAVMGDNKLKPCRVSFVELKKPIPAPTTWATAYDEYLPVGEELLIWSRPFTSIEILDFLQGKDVPSISWFLGKNAKRRIRDQVPFLVGAKITDLNYDSYLRRLPRTIRLKRKDCYRHVPGLP